MSRCSAARRSSRRRAAARPNSACKGAHGTEERVAAERRKLEGQAATLAQLRAADEQVGRAVRETERALERDADALADLQRRRDALDAKLAGKRTELRQLPRRRIPSATTRRSRPCSRRIAWTKRSALAYHRYAQQRRARPHPR